MENSMTTAMALLVVLLAAGVGLSEGAVYKVGDSIGWTIMGSPNYTAWTVSKNFQVGDTIVFEYNKNFHNVLEVSKADYSACNAASPIATYTSGNDSITLKSKGHRFFICGFTGHCSGGQKVDVRLAKSSSSAASSPSPAPSPSTSGASGSNPSPAASPPAANSGTSALPSGVALLLVMLSFTAISAGLVRLY
ncbi:hypothetical protein Cni_G00512 [Canna indica]|uniref:Phytocyanin domain-containing protein n=1 Tax=Canna indica TaxID=4628 RepID=A0AAQ3JKZ0_9LILI|nr:hypothetical protein Cni_G00512 [Canna indica]